MPREIIAPPFIGKAVGYSHAIKVGSTLYVSGQVAQDADGNVVGEGNIEQQVEQVWQNLKGVIGYAGGSLDDIVKITVYTTDIAYRPALAAARGRMFPHGRYPASTFVVVSSLANPAWLVEIEAICELGG
jgi:2-iminobutanoate/2-iminopropanoate deaminase